MRLPLVVIALLVAACQGSPTSSAIASGTSAEASIDSRPLVDRLPDRAGDIVLESESVELYEPDYLAPLAEAVGVALDDVEAVSAKEAGVPPGGMVRAQISAIRFPRARQADLEALISRGDPAVKPFLDRLVADVGPARTIGGRGVIPLVPGGPAASSDEITLAVYVRDDVIYVIGTFSGRDMETVIGLLP